MVAITYGVARASSVDAAPEAKVAAAAPRKHWFFHLVDAMMAARMQQAQREIRMYTRLMPYTVDEQGNRRLRANDMPVGGW